MADLESLGRKSITDMSTDEAIDMLRQIRLSRRIPVKKAPTSKKKKTNAPVTVSANQAEELLKLLTGG